MSDTVAYKDIAKRLGVDPGTVRRFVDRFGAKLGIAVQKGRANTSNAKWSHFLTREDADRLVAFYETQHVGNEEPGSEGSFQRSGFFYVIQLIPEALPNRIKIGYTDNLEQRLADHQSAAPTARVLASWPCKRSWDYAAMDAITREGCTWVLNEVFEGDPEGFVQRARTFFALMPEPNADRPLSSHSPLQSRPRGDTTSDA
jgi:hypothetical protein